MISVSSSLLACDHFHFAADPSGSTSSTAAAARHRLEHGHRLQPPALGSDPIDQAAMLIGFDIVIVSARAHPVHQQQQPTLTPRLSLAKHDSGYGIILKYISRVSQQSAINTIYEGADYEKPST